MYRVRGQVPIPTMITTRSSSPPYCMLLEDYLGEPVRTGYLYLFGTNERYAITITDWHKNKVLQVVEAIRNMSLDKIPDFVNNPNKCKKCSTVQYCLPEETRILEKESARKEYGGKDMGVNGK